MIPLRKSGRVTFTGINCTSDILRTINLYVARTDTKPVIPTVLLLMQLSPCLAQRTVRSVIHYVIASLKLLRPRFQVMMSPTANKLIPGCLRCHSVLVNTNVFSYWIISIALKPINLWLIVTTKCAPMKPCRVVRSPWEAPTASRIFEGAGASSVPKWSVTTISYERGVA